MSSHVEVSALESAVYTGSAVVRTTVEKHYFEIEKTRVAKGVSEAEGRVVQNSLDLRSQSIRAKGTRIDKKRRVS